MNIRSMQWIFFMCEVAAVSTTKPIITAATAIAMQSSFQPILNEAKHWTKSNQTEPKERNVIFNILCV